MAPRPLTLLVCALGGEGGGVLAQWLYDTAVACGHSAQATSIPGVAQRTGATTYYIEIWPQSDAELGARRPLFSLNPVPGAIDLLVSSELLETVRQIGLGLSSQERTLIVSSSARALTVAEKAVLGDGRRDDAALLATLQAHARACEVLDMTALAREAGTAISAVLFGAIAASGRLPFPRQAYENTIRRSGKGVAASLRGFAAAFDALAASRTRREQMQAVVAQALAPAPAPPAATLPAPLQAEFPPAVHEMLALGRARLIDYQDAAYAELYLTRLRRVLAAERLADPEGRQGWAATRETARWLALWMAFDDIVRVALLKLRTSRGERVRREVAARDDELVKIYDYFKPGVPELAALLPERLAQALTAWDHKRQARGLDPWTLALKVGSHTVLGTLALRIAAGLKGQRRRGSRWATEQTLIETWLAALQSALGESWALGHEAALCGRLIKGYGSTNERSKRNLLHITQHLLAPGTASSALAREQAVHAARTAALQDEAGTALDIALAAHGAPPRPVPAQPIRWHRRRPGVPGAR